MGFAGVAGCTAAAANRGDNEAASSRAVRLRCRACAVSFIVNSPLIKVVSYSVTQKSGASGFDFVSLVITPGLIGYTYQIN
jgi:hypothetical protein